MTDPKPNLLIRLTTTAPTDRGFEIVIGAILMAFIPVLLFTGGSFIEGMGWGRSALLLTVVTAVSSVLLARIAYRLLSGQRRSDGGLLPPAVVLVGSLVLATAWIINVIFAEDEPSSGSVVVAVATGLITLAAGARLAWVRHRQRKPKQG